MNNHPTNRAIQIIQALPSPVLRDGLEGYLISVYASAPEIFKEVGIKKEETLLENFLFCAVVRRLWSIIHTQNWLLRSSSKTTSSDLFQGFTVGAKDFSRGGKDYEELVSFYDEFSSFLDEAGLGEIVRAPTLSEVLMGVRHGGKLEF